MNIFYLDKNPRVCAEMHNDNFGGRQLRQDFVDVDRVRILL